MAVHDDVDEKIVEVVYFHSKSVFAKGRCIDLSSDCFVSKRLDQIKGNSTYGGICRKVDYLVCSDSGEAANIIVDLKKENQANACTEGVLVIVDERERAGVS